MDGTILRTRDTPDNRQHFGAQLYPSGAIASYPQARGVTLTVVPTHIVHSAAFGPYGTGEMTFAKQLVVDIPNDSLTVFDKGFQSAEILCTLTQNGKSGTSLSQPSRIRAGKSSRAMPTIAPCVCMCPHKRGRNVLTCRSTGRRAVGTALTLRSRTPEGVYQEIWGTLIAYNLIRLEIARAALAVKCEPTEVSFIRAFHLIQFELHWAAVTRSYGKLPASMKHLRERLVSLLKEERPGRKFNRAVKALPQRYAVRVLKQNLN
jgi:hypothetical protein